MRYLALATLGLITLILSLQYHSEETVVSRRLANKEVSEIVGSGCSLIKTWTYKRSNWPSRTSVTKYALVGNGKGKYTILYRKGGKSADFESRKNENGEHLYPKLIMTTTNKKGKDVAIKCANYICLRKAGKFEVNQKESGLFIKLTKTVGKKAISGEVKFNNDDKKAICRVIQSLFEGKWECTKTSSDVKQMVAGVKQHLDKLIRGKWTVGSGVSVFSASNNKWVEAEITKIEVVEGYDWLTLKYYNKNGPVEKQVWRYDTDVVRRSSMTEADHATYMSDLDAKYQEDFKWHDDQEAYLKEREAKRKARGSFDIVQGGMDKCSGRIRHV